MPKTSPPPTNAGYDAVDQYLAAEEADAAPSGAIDSDTEDALRQRQLMDDIIASNNKVRKPAESDDVSGNSIEGLLSERNDFLKRRGRIGTVTDEDYTELNHGLAALPHIENDD